MAKTTVRSEQILDATVSRADMNVATAGKAVTTKIVAGTGVTISGTGADSGTGDVTVNATGSGPTTVSTITTTGTQTALTLPAGTGDLVLICNNATLLTIQGIGAGLDGQHLTIISKGAGQVDFAHQHASASAANRLLLFATSGLTSLAAGSGVATFQYDLTTTRWRLTSHVQGALITVAYAAGNFTGTVGTWVVDAGDQAAFAYYLSGRTLTVWLGINTSTTTGSPQSLIVAQPVGFVATKFLLNAGVYLSLATVPEVGYVLTAAGIGIYITRLSNVAMPNLTNQVEFSCTFVYEVN